MLKILNRKIELNKIHQYFITFQKFRWTVKFRGKTRPFNVLERIKVLFSTPSICNKTNGSSQRATAHMSIMDREVIGP